MKLSSTESFFLIVILVIFNADASAFVPTTSCAVSKTSCNLFAPQNKSYRVKTNHKRRYSRRTRSLLPFLKVRDATETVKNQKYSWRKFLTTVAVPATIWFKGPVPSANAMNVWRREVKPEPISIEKAGYSNKVSIPPRLVATVAVLSSSVGGIAIKKRKDHSATSESHKEDEKSVASDDIEERKEAAARQKIDDLVSKALERMSGVEDSHNPNIDDKTDDSMIVAEEDEDMLAIEALTSVRAQAEVVLAAKAESDIELHTNDISLETNSDAGNISVGLKNDFDRFEKTSYIEDPGEKAFAILLDLGMITLHPDPDDPDYDHSKDDELAPENVWI